MANDNAEVLLTNINDILLENEQYINNFKIALADLSEACIRFINQYDEYVYESVYDASYLKARMKDRIMEAVADELY